MSEATVEEEDVWRWADLEGRVAGCACGTLDGAEMVRVSCLR